MNAGTKVFLAVVALLVGVMILYYGAFQTGDHPSPAMGGTVGRDTAEPAPNRPAEGPAVRNAVSPQPAHFDQPVLRNESTPRVGSLDPIPPANDPLADLGTPANISNSAGLPSETMSPPDSTTSRGSGAGAPHQDTSSNNSNHAFTPGGTTPTAPRPEIKSNTATPKPAEVHSQNKTATTPGSLAGGSKSSPGKPTEGVNYTMYTVKNGDTGVSIAEEWFGDSAKWKLISKANPMVDFNRLKIGQKLRLPPKDATDEAPKPPTIAGKPETTSGGTTSDPNTYIVKSGDSLIAIARARYGDGSLWETIYDANKKTIGDDPAALQVGMKLTIPAKPKN